MPQDYYADAAPAAEPPAGDNPKESTSDSNVATLPKSVLGGKEWKPGEEIVLQIVQVTEDGAVVKYATEEHEDKGPHDETAERSESPMASMYEDTGGGNPGGNPGRY